MGEGPLAQAGHTGFPPLSLTCLSPPLPCPASLIPSGHSLMPGELFTGCMFPQLQPFVNNPHDFALSTNHMDYDLFTIFLLVKHNAQVSLILTNNIYGATSLS